MKDIMNMRSRTYGFFFFPCVKQYNSFLVGSIRASICTTPQAMSFKKLSCLNKGILFYSMKGFALGLALNRGESQLGNELFAYL